ncbi:MAG TPA: pyrroline-5-carboxylate reductase [Propioniciclava sp.]|uniref:pyrroline-5-carboxylate reductase n=1 Tax=Propioniciclava sp. TaxID=2038686 RepID=UPI002C3BC2FB|nr:pyrroline-5-carboxylate reductase [Propioniciclava sp.]HRL49341.1 pyrroline-5-carboxylate reductase [Propioniciclava sp.]HRL79887.1 pyrroline-5-carboxylate reductase [Propioniciclava sp.]
MTQVALLGVGAMGEIILSGLLRAGWDASEVVGAARRAERREELASRYGVRMEATVEAATAGADAVLVGVKPYDALALLPQIAPHLAPGAVVISLCAGITTAQMEAQLPDGTPVIRVMPNTPAELGVGMSVISAGAHASEADLARAVSLMEAVGKAVVIPESHQDAATAISGSGPAYIFYVAEALADAGVLLGLPRAVATALATQTLLGSSTLLDASGQHATLLRERVTSPGGTTAAALRVLDDRAVKAAFIAAAEACRDRSAELGR